MRPAPDPSRAVCFRTDRIGDLLMTMPAMAALSRTYPHCRVTAVVSPLTRQLIEGQPWVHEVFVWDHTQPLAPLTDFLRRSSFDTAVLFYPRFKPALAAVLARIPVRIGTLYRWYSFLFTHRVAVHRSANIHHEVEYNLELLQPLRIYFSPSKEVGGNLIAPVISDEASAEAESLLQRQKIPRPYLVVHPTCGGSALNATPEHYGDIARLLEGAGYFVVLTGTTGESAQVLAATRTAGLPESRFIAPGNLSALAAVLREACAVVGPATGPLHLAASLGVPTVALYAPMHTQSPVRWRPRGDRGVVLLPHPAVCPSCLGPRCPMYNCVNTIDPDRVLDAVRSLLKK